MPSVRMKFFIYCQVILIFSTLNSKYKVLLLILIWSISRLLVQKIIKNQIYELNKMVSSLIEENDLEK